jgi:hypothetical protein
LENREPDRLLTPTSVRWIGTGVAMAVVVFAAMSLALQWVRVDLDWVRNTLSAYLTGPHGAWLKAAYFQLSCALVLLGLGYHRAVAPPARSRVPALLFAVAGVALTVTALADTSSHSDRSGSRLESMVHNAAAALTFLTVTVAMLIQSWTLRRDEAWRHRFAALFSLAVACFAGLWIFLFWHAAPRGLAQKILIAAILAWLALAAWWLRVHSTRAPPQ